MRESWLQLVESVLRPARPNAAHCETAREEHLAARRILAEERSREITRCEQRIDAARAAVFAANDGVIGSLMTDLEREWRILSRPDPDRGLMDLWAQIAPAPWVDRKRWRDADPHARLDAAAALAADVAGVEAAEVAIEQLRVSLAPWGTSIGSRIRWRSFDDDHEHVPALCAAPLAALHAIVTLSDVGSIALERAARLERDVHDAVTARLPDRPALARDLGHAAFVETLYHAAGVVGRPNPIAPLRALWRTGYVLGAVDVAAVTVEFPPL